MSRLDLGAGRKAVGSGDRGRGFLVESGQLLAMLDEIERLRALLPECWDAASAHAVASHKDFKQTHPGKAEWIREALVQ